MKSIAGKKKVLRAFGVNLYSRQESEQQHWLMVQMAAKYASFHQNIIQGHSMQSDNGKKGKIQGSKSHGRQKMQQRDTKEAEAGISTDEFKVPC